MFSSYCFRTFFKNRLHFRFIALTFTHRKKILSRFLSLLFLLFAREEGAVVPGLCWESVLRDGEKSVRRHLTGACFLF